MRLKKQPSEIKLCFEIKLNLLFSTQEEAIVEKIGYPEMCVNKTLLEEYYKEVSIKRATYQCVSLLS